MTPVYQLALGGAAGSAVAYAALTLLRWQHNRIVVALNAFGTNLLTVVLSADYLFALLPATIAVGFAGGCTSIAALASTSGRVAIRDLREIVTAVTLNIGICVVAALNTYLFSHVFFSIYQKICPFH
ncbi:hypothetical protein W823_23510 [Williamsia sp. D3]|nr:hypothetical protein W823_23510 [Williamsia sp. D3]